ncbi:unnamed protein product [Rotaria sordida]|uniref:Uncharacterized protein n=1 Tax=Rotaria sordida TaxID=392033 RepID=A0A814H284_9BILA|nr:unnamed protein product [Rotaria sordida]
MSSSNITNDIVAATNALRWDSILFVRCWCITMFILGCIGHSLNIYVFTRPALYFNPCGRYFLASAISGYLVVFVNIPIRFLQLGYKLNLFLLSVEICKIVSFLFFSIRILPCWFIALASADRILPCWFIALASADRFFCSSRSATLRCWSSIRVSKILPCWFIALASADRFCL